MSDHRYDIVALVSNDLVTDQRMQRCLTSLCHAGFKCLLLGRERPNSKPLSSDHPFDQERHHLSADAGKGFYLQLNKAHQARLLALKPKAILVVDLDTMLAGASAARTLGIPWVYDAHELFCEQPEVARRWWIKAVWSWVEKRYVRKAAAAYTVGQEIASILSEKHRVPVSTVRNLPWARPAVPQEIKTKNDQPIVLYQGALNEGRGLEELIQAAQQLPNYTFWIAGGGYLRPQLDALVKELDLSNVVFHGELTPEQLHELTPQADIGYALMRNTSLNYYLSLSNKSIDYIQAGLPSLQMDWPEYRAIHEQFGCYQLVSEISKQAVVDGLAALQDELIYKELQAGCTRAARALTWELEQEKLVGIWEEVLG
ncbi:MAG: glycosyltransferase [Saprospiraceae bacterium]